MANGKSSPQKHKQSTAKQRIEINDDALRHVVGGVGGQSGNKDKDYFQNKMSDYNKTGDALSDYSANLEDRADKRR